MSLTSAIKDYRNGYVEFLVNEDDDLPTLTIRKLKCASVIRDEHDGSYADAHNRNSGTINQAGCGLKTQPGSSVSQRGKLR